MKQSFAVESLRSVSFAKVQTFSGDALLPKSHPSNHVILYLENGTLELTINKRTMELHSDDVLVLHSSDEFHSLHSVSDTSTVIHIQFPGNRADEPFSYYNMPQYHYPRNGIPVSGVPRNEMRSMFTVMSQTPTGQNNAKKVQLSSLLHCQRYPYSKILFEEIVNAYSSLDKNRDTKLNHMINLLLCILEECDHDELPDDVIASQIVTMIQQNPQIYYTNKDFSKYFYICDKTLNHRFKNVYSKSIYEYQTEYKLELVRNTLLSHPSIKLSELAMNYGFYDAFHLSKLFKKQYGRSPRQYLTELKSNQA